MSAVLCDLFGVTLCPPHTSLCAIKESYVDFQFSQPQPSKNGLWDKQLVFVSKSRLVT